MENFNAYAILRKIERNKYIPLFFALCLIDFFYDIVISYLIGSYDPSLFDSTSHLNLSLRNLFIYTVIFGPLLETFIFHYLIIEYLYKKKVKDFIIVGISTGIFSVLHFYNVFYILVIVFPGVMYATYYLYLKRNHKKFPFLYIFSLHAFANLTTFILNDILNL